MQKLIETVRKLLADHRGLLAMDESTGACNKRFAAVGIPQTEEARRPYRELIVTTPGLGERISGAILSGGQSAELASARLNAMNHGVSTPRADTPWVVTFPYSRAIQQPALELWAGKDANRAAARRACLHRAQCDRAARRGEYSPDMEAKAS